MLCVLSVSEFGEEGLWGADARSGVGEDTIRSSTSSSLILLRELSVPYMVME